MNNSRLAREQRKAERRGERITQLLITPMSESPIEYKERKPAKRCQATIAAPVNTQPPSPDYRCDLEEGHEGYHFAAGYPWSGWGAP